MLLQLTEFFIDKSRFFTQRARAVVPRKPICSAAAPAAGAPQSRGRNSLVFFAQLTLFQLLLDSNNSLETHIFVPRA